MKIAKMPKPTDPTMLKIFTKSLKPSANIAMGGKKEKNHETKSGNL